MVAIERANQPKFDGILKSRIDFNKGDERPREKRINLINHFSRGKRPSPGRGRRRCAPSRRRRRTRRTRRGAAERLALAVCPPRFGRLRRPRASLTGTKIQLAHQAQRSKHQR